MLVACPQECHVRVVMHFVNPTHGVGGLFRRSLQNGSDKNGHSLLRAQSSQNDVRGKRAVFVSWGRRRLDVNIPPTPWVEFESCITTDARRYYNSLDESGDQDRRYLS